MYMGAWKPITERKGAWAMLGLLLLVLFAGCTGGMEEAGGISVSSDAFVQDQPIPVRYTCLGDDISPAVSWEGAPTGTQSFAVIIEDPDAPGGLFTHWLVYGIPADQSVLPEGLPEEMVVAGGIQQGTNDFGTVGYRGPCPPEGSSHRYLLRVYALDGMMNLAGGADRRTFDAVIKGHVLGAGETGAVFGR
jgi:Raf kinase inhibitor-like YbhB/YbcL family protein